MKKILLLGALFLLVSCSKDDNKMWNIDAMFALNVDTSVRSSRVQGHLTPLEVVQQANDLTWYHIEWGGFETSARRGFADRQRDFTNQRLLMFGFDIIYPEIGTGTPKYKTGFIEGWDMVLEGPRTRDKETGLEICDTIAYIPNSVLLAAKEIIKPAFERGDFDTCYKAFDEAFTFIPITGAEWRALKAKDEN